MISRAKAKQFLVWTAIFGLAVKFIYFQAIFYILLSAVYNEMLWTPFMVCATTLAYLLEAHFGGLCAKHKDDVLKIAEIIEEVKRELKND